MNKTALITGGARGIGRGIAEALAKDQFNIAILYVSADDAAKETVEACKRTGASAMAIKSDISNTSAHENICEQIQQEYGRLDVLVNNAGVGPKNRLDILETSEDSYDWVMNVNLRGPFFLTRRIANRMIDEKKKDSSFEPMIINISSISAYTSSPNRGEYCLSKAGMSMMTLLFADRLAEYNINVYEIRPGIIQTDMTSGVQEKYNKLINQGLYPIKRWGQPEDIGKAVRAIAGGALPFSTGEVINVDGGFHMKRL